MKGGLMSEIGPSSQPPYVSVIIPVYNDFAHLNDLMISLVNQTYGSHNFEVIVVDNGSDEDVSSITDKFNVTLLYENKVQSSYAARNKGISVAKGEVFAFIDSDCKADNNWIDEGMKSLEQKDVSLVGGNVIFAFSEKKRAAEYYDAVNNFQFEEKIKRGTCGGGNLFVKKKVFDIIGIFDGSVKSGGDVMFSRKATESGLKLLYAPKAIVFHPTRTFRQLAIKTFRVGVGKSDINKSQPNSFAEKTPKLVQSGSILSLLSPFELKKKLTKSGYDVGLCKFLAIVFTGYAILAVGALGVLWGSFFKRRPKFSQTVDSHQTYRDTTTKTKSGRIKKIIRWSIAALCVGYVVYFFWTEKQNIQVAFNLKPWIILSIMTGFLIYLLLYSYRLRLVITKCSGKKIAFSKWFRLIVLARFLNRIIPQSGNIYRGVNLKNDYQISYTQYITAYVSFAWMDTFLNLLIASVVLVIMYPSLKIAEINASFLLGLLTVTIALAPVVFLKMCHLFELRFQRPVWATSKLSEVLEVTMHNLKDLGYVLKVAGLGVLTFIHVCVMFYLFFRCVDLHLSPPITILFYSIFKLSTFINITPGNIGTRELAYGIIGEMMNIGMGHGILVSMITRIFGTIFIFSMGLLFGGAGILRKKYRESNTK
jgi:glycosyltransferase involved in cell wall biosynthesis